MAHIKRLVLDVSKNFSPKENSTTTTIITITTITTITIITTITTTIITTTITTTIESPHGHVNHEQLWVYLSDSNNNIRATTVTAAPTLASQPINDNTLKYIFKCETSETTLTALSDRVHGHSPSRNSA